MIETLRTIRNVFARNLRTLRGDRTQRQIADAAGISLRSYHQFEKGSIPKEERVLAKLAAVFHTSEVHLFLDPDLQVIRQMTPLEAVKLVEQTLLALDAKSVPANKRRLIELIAKTKDAQIALLEPIIKRFALSDLSADHRRALEVVLKFLANSDDAQARVLMQFIERGLSKVKRAGNSGESTG